VVLVVSATALVALSDVANAQETVDAAIATERPLPTELSTTVLFEDMVTLKGVATLPRAMPNISRTCIVWTFSGDLLDPGEEIWFTFPDITQGGWGWQNPPAYGIPKEQVRICEDFRLASSWFQEGSEAFEIYVDRSWPRPTASVHLTALQIWVMGGNDRLGLDLYWGPTDQKTLAYSNVDALASGDYVADPATGRPTSITGSGAIRSASSIGSATVTLHLTFDDDTARWSGTVTVHDPGAAFSATIPIKGGRYAVWRVGSIVRGVLWGIRGRSVPQKCFKVTFSIDDVPKG
jgi:hypothetical protein